MPIANDQCSKTLLWGFNEAITSHEKNHARSPIYDDRVNAFFDLIRRHSVSAPETARSWAGPSGTEISTKYKSKMGPDSRLTIIPWSKQAVACDSSRSALLLPASPSQSLFQIPHIIGIYSQWFSLPPFLSPVSSGSLPARPQPIPAMTTLRKPLSVPSS